MTDIKWYNWSWAVLEKKAEYRYDGLGRRIAKIIDPDGDNGSAALQITTYVYNGDNLLAEYNADDTMTARYLYTGKVDDILMMSRDLDGNHSFTADEYFFFHKNHLGSVTNITDISGNEVKSYKYRPYGELFDEWTSPSLSDNFSNNILFTGRELDRESGLYFLRARYYDPQIGRFLQEDPVWSTNLYSYGANNPVANIDRFGQYIVWTNNVTAIQKVELKQILYTLQNQNSFIASTYHEISRRKDITLTIDVAPYYSDGSINHAIAYPVYMPDTNTIIIPPNYASYSASGINAYYNIMNFPSNFTTSDILVDLIGHEWWHAYSDLLAPPNLGKIYNYEPSNVTSSGSGIMTFSVMFENSVRMNIFKSKGMKFDLATHGRLEY